MIVIPPAAADHSWTARSPVPLSHRRPAPLPSVASSGDDLLRTRGIVDALKRNLPPPPRTAAPRLPRRVPVPLPQPYLDFLELPVPEACVWAQLTDQEKTTVIAAMARLMARAAAGHHQEPAND